MLKEIHNCILFLLVCFFSSFSPFLRFCENKNVLYRTHTKIASCKFALLCEKTKTISPKRRCIPERQQKKRNSEKNRINHFKRPHQLLTEKIWINRFLTRKDVRKLHDTKYIRVETSVYIYRNR